MKKGWFFVVFFCIGFLRSPHTGLSEPSFQSTLNCENLFAGQSCELKIHSEWPKQEGQYLLAVPDPEVENLRIQRRGESQEALIKAGNEWTQKTFLFELQPLQAGTATVKEIQIQYVDSSSNKTGKFVVPQSSFEIRRPDKMKSILGAGLAGFLLVSAVAALLSIRFRRKGESTQRSAAPSIAEQLHELHKKISAGAAPKELSHELGKEFRTYLISHYQLSAAANTEDELTQEIQKKVLPLEEERQVIRLLSELREAKFIQREFADRNFENLVEKILEFVEKRQVL